LTSGWTDAGGSLQFWATYDNAGVVIVGAHRWRMEGGCTMEALRSGTQYRQDPHLWGTGVSLGGAKITLAAYNARIWSLDGTLDGEGSPQNRFFDSLVGRLVRFQSQVNCSTEHYFSRAAIALCSNNFTGACSKASRKPTQLSTSCISIISKGEFK